MSTRSGEFTSQAETLLVTETEDFGVLLRGRAAEEAFKARGEPVEVTASDVQRASDWMLGETTKTPRPGAMARGITRVGIMLCAAALFMEVIMGKTSFADFPMNFLSEGVLMYGIVLLLVGQWPKLIPGPFRSRLMKD